MHEDEASAVRSWEEQRAQLLRLLERIRGSNAGPYVEPELLGIERTLRAIERELSVSTTA